MEEEKREEQEKDISIKSPKENVAEKQMIAIEDANIRIKKLIVKSLRVGVDLKELNKQILEIIEENGEFLKKYPKLHELYTQTMKASTQRWFRYYTENLKKINTRAVNKFTKIGIAVSNINAIYSNQNVFRKFVANNPKGLAVIADYEKLVKRELNKLIVDNPIATITDKNGVVKRRSLRNEAETYIRLQANKEDIVNLKKSGVKFVMTTSHADASKRCEKWQGKLYSLDGTSGVYKGMRYIPLEKAMQGENNDGNGIISGYNCRHRAIVYKDGMTAPTEYSKAFIKKQREIDSKQRYYERQIRNYKIKEELLRGGGFNQEASVIRKKWQIKTSEYKYFSLKNKRAYYEWRTRISLNEKEQIIQSEIAKQTM